MKRRIVQLFTIFILVLSVCGETVYGAAAYVSAGSYAEQANHAVQSAEKTKMLQTETMLQSVGDIAEQMDAVVQSAENTETSQTDDSVQSMENIAAEQENAEMIEPPTEDVVETGGNVADPLGIVSPSALLMELSSGKVLYEKDADTPRRPASVTKLMTMLLAFEMIDSGRMNLTDTITVSEHAASMGGSQVYLESGEQQSVEDILKCMVVSSANDAAVAMAEAIGGSEPAFVSMMNEKAAELGMTGTHFENACGLEAEGHLMTARDIAILSRELLLKHPTVTKYTTIWMDTITHHTARGDSEFGLANTNKFLKKYEGSIGLKTGYTSVAGFSMSAAATRNGTTLIAVVMGSSTKDIRYQDAAALLDYGYANCKPYADERVLDGENMLPVENGTKNELAIQAEQPFRTVLIGNEDAAGISKELVTVNNTAPIEAGEVVARMEYRLDGNVIGSVNVLAAESVEEQKYKNVLERIFHNFINLYD